MKRYKNYIETTEFPSNTHLEVNVYYDKGGMNYFNGRAEARGFYLSVTPVKKERGCVSMVLGSGYKKLISIVNRYSEKQHDIAIEKSRDSVQELINALKSEQKSA